jgi:hypothetical protein
MEANYTVVESKHVQERGGICDLCHRPLRQGELVFILALDGATAGQ